MDGLCWDFTSMWFALLLHLNFTMSSWKFKWVHEWDGFTFDEHRSYNWRLRLTMSSLGLGVLSAGSWVYWEPRAQRHMHTITYHTPVLIFMTWVWKWAVLHVKPKTCMCFCTCWSNWRHSLVMVGVQVVTFQLLTPETFRCQPSAIKWIHN